jgi:hypothetical protein
MILKVGGKVFIGTGMSLKQWSVGRKMLQCMARASSVLAQCNEFLVAQPLLCEYRILQHPNGGFEKPSHVAVKLV